MRVSVVIAAHNEGVRLLKTLESLYETSTGIDFETIVVDDGSTDGSVAAAARDYPRIKLLKLSERQGPAAAKDFGADEAKGDTLVFLDAHTKPEQGAVQRLIEQVERLKGQALLVPRVPALDPVRWRNSRSQFGYGYAINLWTFSTQWKALGDLKAAGPDRPGLYESPALIGCAFAVDHDLYERLWGQDVHMRNWGVEDIDLGLKAWLAGYPVLLDPTASIGHRFQSQFDSYQISAPQLVANQLRMARKNFTESVWNDWLQLARARFTQATPDAPEGIWARAWTLFENDRASVEHERSALMARRVRDEFWYAEYFGLEWPVIGASLALGNGGQPSTVGGIAQLKQLLARGDLLGELTSRGLLASFGASPSPSPGPSNPEPPTTPGCNKKGGCKCPPLSAASGGPINYGSGQIVLSVTDISSDAFSTPWSHTRTYSNRLSSSADLGQGFNWLVDTWPYLVEKENDAIAVVRGTTGSLWFDLGLDGYLPKFGSLSTLVHDVDRGVFILTEPDGTQQEYHDFTQTSFPRGLFSKQIDASGLVTSVESYVGSGFIGEIRRAGTFEDQTLTEAFAYSYNADGQLESLTLRRQHGTDDWVDVRQALYSYWDGTDSFGSAGDLQQVTIQTPVEGGWADSTKSVYRYLLESHLLKFVVNPATYQQMVTDGVDPLTAPDGTVALYADFYYEYVLDDTRVGLERTNGGAQEYRFEYLQYPYPPIDDFPNQWLMRTEEYLPDGNRNIYYTNAVGQTLVKEFTTGSDSWIDGYQYGYHEYDRNQEIMHAHPSAIVRYVANEFTFPNIRIYLKPEAGLIDHTDYYETTGSGAAQGYVAARRVSEGEYGPGSIGEEIVLTSYEYTSRTVGETTVFPVSKETRYRNEDGTGGQETSYEYDYYPDTVQVQQKTTAFPVVPTEQNGDGIAATRNEFFNELGQLTWVMDERGYITRYSYDLATGSMLQQVQDVDTFLYDDVPDGWETPEDGGLNLITDFVVDEMGRTIQSLGPWHEIDIGGTATNIRQASWTVYDDDNHVTYSGQGYATGTDPDYDFTLINPVSIQQMDAGNKVLANISAAASSTDGSLREIIEDAGGGAAAFPQTSYVRWQTTQYTQCCLVASQRVYFDIPSSGDGTEGINYNQTNFGYDSMQRWIRAVAPGGTIKHVVLDPRGLPVAAYVGTNDDGATESDPTGGGGHPGVNNMVIVMSNVYDNGDDGGDGNLTEQTRYASASDTRVTAYTYDFRNRQLTIDGEIDYFQKSYYDNLNQKIRVERYDTDEEGNLIALSESLFDDRGQLYRTIRYGVNPETGAVGNALTSNTWYDAAGNRIESLPAGSKLANKTRYDSLGRRVVQYSGYTPDPDDVDPASVENDVILQQAESVYDDASNIIQTTMRQRYHNAPDTELGPLGDPSTAPNARVTYDANWPNPLGRAQAAASYGTNGGTAITRPPTIPSRSDTVLVSSQAYDNAGQVFETIAPTGIVTRMAYDDAGRETTLIENYQDSVLTLELYEEDCDPSDDTNRTTQYTYNPDGNQATMTAVNSRTGNQTTTYTYGTTLSDSDIAASLLLRSVTYPNSVSGSDVVVSSYNRQGQRKSFTDQRGCVRSLDYDKLGRLVQDRVTTLGSGVDGMVRRLWTSYDVRGQVFQSTSYDNATVGSGTILNQVQKSYNDFQQLVTEYQAHGGAVNTSTTPKVQYTFADGSDNTVRPTGMIYPDGRTLTFDYEGAASVSDQCSRIAAIIDDDETTLVEYEYLSLNSFVIASNPEPDIQWSLASLDGEDDPETGDIYSGLDRLGRIKDCRWYNNGTEEDAVRLKYGYDRDSNRLWREDGVARSLGKSFDELYAYDGLQRLKTMQRGLLNGVHTSISGQIYSQCWNLDATENWTGMKQAEGGSDWTLEQTRTANTVNEITDITNVVGSAWAQPAYDAAGNMTTIPKSNAPSAGPNWSDLTADQWNALTADEWASLQFSGPTDKVLTATWDAWNRLVKLVDADSSETIAEYQYDARNWRIVKKLYDVGDVDQTCHVYLSNQNQVLEERIDSSTDAGVQNVWGLMYIDGLILRDRDATGTGTLSERLYCLQDANWNTVALVDSAGNVAHRFCYQPYGIVEFLTASYGPGSNTVLWTTLFTGRELDLISGLNYFRGRYFSACIGTFISRDPLRYVDGSNYYAAYYAPGETDPYGYSGTGTPPCPGSCMELALATAGTTVTGVNEKGKTITCPVRVYCSSQCTGGGGARQNESGAGISICMNSKINSDSDLMIIYVHELQHAKDFCGKDKDKLKADLSSCDTCEGYEGSAHAASCAVSFDVGTEDFERCMKCGVWISCLQAKACDKPRPTPCDWGTLGVGMDGIPFPFPRDR